MGECISVSVLFEYFDRYYKKGGIFEYPHVSNSKLRNLVHQILFSSFILNLIFTIKTTYLE